MNSVMQCFGEVTEMREYYLDQAYAEYKTLRTKRDSFDFCNSFYLFYKALWTQDIKVFNNHKLKDATMRKFYPVMQHDCHEFFCHVLSSLQDEETPQQQTVSFDGIDTKKSIDEKWMDYHASHPSIIDKLFTGKFLFVIYYW